ncbi:MAG: nucleoside diphosphate kinase regulator [Bdellovibrio sp.]|nr:nucleoside diphosphate kinase regulator [Bdellovibrio sp.]
MNAQQIQRIFITDQDYHRLSALVSQHATDTAMFLEEELSRAHVMAQSEIPPDIVTMNSRVRYLDEETGQEHEVTLVYPQDANVEQGRVSIMAPLGAALLGLSVGQKMEWKLPNGSAKRLIVKAVLFQPEAEGHFHL